MPYLSARDGERLHYHDVGRGPPCVLLHGFAMPAALWLPFVLPHAHRFRFILPDLRGFGRSHGLSLSNDCLLTQNANDLADLVDGLGLDDVRLAGLSMGACTALQYHRHYGFGRVRSYLHIDQGPCIRNGPDWPHGLFGTAQAQRLAPWRGLLAELAQVRDLPFQALPPALRRRVWRGLAEFFGEAFHGAAWRALVACTRYEPLIRTVTPVANWPVYADCVRSYLTHDYDWRDSLPRIDVPMTALVGLNSRMYPAAGQLQMRDWVPRLRLVPIDDCGHAIPFEAPRRFAAELRQFLDAA